MCILVLALLSISRFTGFTDYWLVDNRQLLWLADRIAESPDPVIVAGDFNTTPFSPVFQEMLARSGLKDLRVGRGWQPSWPTYMPLFWLPIDHILVSSEIQVYRVSTGKFIWSDHYPMIAELSIRNKDEINSPKAVIASEAKQSRHKQASSLSHKIASLRSQ